MMVDKEFRAGHDADANAFGRRLEAEENRVRVSGFVVAVSLCVLGVVLFAFFGAGESGQGRILSLEERVNPNEASVGSLVRLPGIGVSKAVAIIAYRDGIVEEQGSSGLAFRDCNDLRKVSGIGPKTVENIGGLLKFE